MAVFQYDPALLERYPGVAGGVIVASGLHNGPSPDALRDAYAREQAAVVTAIGSRALSEIESLAAWRAAFRAFGVDPTQYRSAAEALLRRLTKKGDIPGINTLVDIGNLVSIRYALPVAVFDRRALHGPITVRFARGDEVFTNLGQEAPEHPAPGEVIFADERDTVVARRWCWRQSNESGAREDTTAAVITVEAHHADAARAVRRATDDLIELLEAHAGGSFQSALLTRERPAL